MRLPLTLRPDLLLGRLLETLWFIPSMITVVAVGLAYGTVAIDRNLVDPEYIRTLYFLFDIGEEGARSTLTAIATSVITVTGVVFSVTIVALQLAATQFTPRVLRTFLSDRGNQVVLGIFIGTFTYTLMVQRTVGTAPGSDESFVPSIAVTVSIVFVLISIGGLIYFVNHIAQSIRASVIIANVTRDARSLVEHFFPDGVGEDIDALPAGSAMPPEPIGEPRLLRSSDAGYLDSVDTSRLLTLGDRARMVVRMERRIGAFILPGEVLGSVWFDADAPDPDRKKAIMEEVRASFKLGGQWTLHQDLERAIVELTDIASRALSPSLNDPTTAAMCVDRLAEVLVALGSRDFPGLCRTDEARRVRFEARQMTWDHAVETCFDKIRRNARDSPTVLTRMIELCGRIKEQTPAHRHSAIDRTIEEMIRAARSGYESERDLEVAEETAATALAAGRRPPERFTGQVSH